MYHRRAYTPGCTYKPQGEREDNSAQRTLSSFGRKTGTLRRGLSPPLGRIEGTLRKEPLSSHGPGLKDLAIPHGCYSRFYTLRWVIPLLVVLSSSLGVLMGFEASSHRLITRFTVGGG